ncbi:hypothetical protein F9L16_08005 [Agarivorans sp. B2Z047]|uniref:hypothetical protein n=1 Tax=Agarivorans sp. B2Z047 TaxID=2652721 RepID=UPI00128B9ABB|nr:hypothetical protein [Agarivorans sp. B2Z047]MPW28943.1 hypothetical protein [Agarivorans sp. B2Z047]UQN41500.1 hypothetical protein LQZ07_17210 [Agarivorans sp. B2Z047]
MWGYILKFKLFCITFLILLTSTSAFSNNHNGCSNENLKFLNNFYYYADRIGENHESIQKTLAAWDLELLANNYYEVFPNASIGVVIEVISSGVLSREYDSKTRVMTSYAEKKLKNNIVKLVIDVENNNDGDQVFDVMVVHIDLESMKFIGIHHTDEYPPDLEPVKCEIALGLEIF